MTDNLPIKPVSDSLIADVVIPQPEVKDILTDSQAELEEVRKADMKILNFSLAVLHAAWDKVETLPGLFLMIDKQMSLVEKRRAILGLPYGSSQNKSSAKFTFEPIP